MTSSQQQILERRPEAGDSPILSIRDIGLNFGGITAVDGCSFDLAEGSITGLIGPNGAGKSTLFNIIAGVFRPTRGQVLLDGQDVTGLPPHRLFSLGLVRTFQTPHEFARMTVLENLMLVPQGQLGEDVLMAWLRWGEVRKQERQVREKAEWVLSFLQLDRLKNEFAGNLSGGQKKLLELGRTMMAEPRVVLLDEPGAGVNRTLLSKLREHIRSLNRDYGYTFCIIEHDMDLIASLCDPVVVMVEGRVLARGTMEEIRRDQRVLEAYLGGSMTTANGGA